MEQLEMLWAYQQEDIKADRIALEIRRSPKRQQLEKKRDFIMEQQKLFKQLEEKIAVMADRMDMIRHAIPRCEEQLKQLTERVEKNPPADLEAVRALIAEEATTARRMIGEVFEDVLLEELTVGDLILVREGESSF